MAKYCCDCANLKTSDKKDGIEGYCKCSKQKNYVLANMEKCPKFEEAYGRKHSDRDKLYDAAKEVKPPTESIGKDLGFLIILAIAAFICKLFGII